MPKTTFVSKPCDLNEVWAETKSIERRHGGQARDSYYVAEEIQLEENTFFALHEDLMSERDWIRAFSNQAHPMQGDAVPAIRVTCAHSLIALIIDPQGYSYPRYVGIGEASE